MKKSFVDNYANNYINYPEKEKRVLIKCINLGCLDALLKQDRKQWYVLSCFKQYV